VTRGWPVTLQEGRVGLRPIRLRDAAAWREVRHRNADWLRPWEATVPSGSARDDVPPTFGAMVRRLRGEAREGRCLPWVMTYDGALVGHMTVAGISYGSIRGGHIGYWIDRRVAGRGITPTAVAMAVDHCFDVLRLHRIEICIRPENTPSLRVVEKLGMRCEGLRPSYLHIDGAWRDHLCFAVTAQEAPEGLLRRWRQRVST
jgi:[ribosomal protein S5]-alanine N-acetyltransferase